MSISLQMIRHIFICIDMSRHCPDMSQQFLDIPLGYQWCCQRYHCIYKVTMIKMRWNMTFSHVTPLIPSLLSCYAKCIISGTVLFITWIQLKQGEKGLLLFIWCCWHQCQHCMTQISLSMLPFLLAWDDIFCQWCQCWCHMTLMASSIPLLHLLVPDDWNEI